MMNKITQLIGLLGALAVAIITILYPTQVGTWQNIIINMACPALSLIIAIVISIVTGKDILAEKAISLARAEAAKAQAQLRLSQQQQKAFGVPSSNYTYTINDVIIVENEAKADIESNGLKVDKLSLSMYNYTHMSNYDLRPVARETRVPLSKAFLDNALKLLNEAWVFATGIVTPPTPEQAANKSTSMYYFKKEWEKANGMKCGDNIYSTMSSLLGYYNNVYSALAGIDSLIGQTVDYSTFGGGMFSPTSLGWEAANCVL